MKLTKALAAHNLAETCDVVVTPGMFTVTIIEAAGHNQQYNARVARFATTNPDHPCGKPGNSFWADLFAGKMTKDTAGFLRDVLIVDWQLTDDDGEPVPCTPENIDQVLNTDRAGRVVAGKLIRAALTADMFKVEMALGN